MNASEKKLQDTFYTEYYASNFDNWEERLEAVYSEYNSKLGNVVSSRIDDHKYLSNAVTCTTFENGYKVYVNFGYTDFTTEGGLLIPSRDYKVEAK